MTRENYTGMKSTGKLRYFGSRKISKRNWNRSKNVPRTVLGNNGFVKIGARSKDTGKNYILFGLLESMEQ